MDVEGDEEHLKDEAYFQYRGVSPEYYDNYRLPPYFQEALPKEREARILDIGCGFGQMLCALKKQGYRNIEGVDISREACDHCARLGLTVAPIADLESFCKGKPKPEYDLIIMSHVLEHIEKSRIIPTVRSIREGLLVPGGSLLVMVPNAQSNTGCYWAYEDFTHSTLFTAGSLYFVLKASGFGDIKFLDPEGLEGGRLLFRLPKKVFLRYYRARIHFWNLVTNSAFHTPSPQIFTFELKALAR